MSDSNHDYTRYEEWGDRNRYDEVQASTIVLRGAEDTMAALDLQQSDHPKKAGFRTIWNSVRGAGKRHSAGKQPPSVGNSAEHHGIQRIAPKLGGGRTSTPKQHRKATTSRPLRLLAHLKGRRGQPTEVSETCQALSEISIPLPRTGTCQALSEISIPLPQPGESTVTPIITARGRGSSRTPVDPSSRATSSNDVLHRPNSAYLPAFKDQVRFENVEPQNIVPVVVPDEPSDPPSQGAGNYEPPDLWWLPRRNLERAESTYHRQLPPAGIKEPQGDLDTKPGAVFKNQVPDSPEEHDAKPKAIDRSELSQSNRFDPCPFLGEVRRTAPKKSAIRLDPPSGFEAGEIGVHFKVREPASIPLSQIIRDCLVRDLPSRVHNDIVKIILVAPSSIDKSRLAQRICSQPNAPWQHDDQEHTNLTIDVFDWCPSKVSQGSPGIKYSIWSVNGPSSNLDGTNNSTIQDRKDFGFHPAVQSIFFSPGSMYLLVWDMACNSRGLTNTKFRSVEMARQALRADIVSRMLPWLDCIVQQFPGSVVLPVALIPSGMSDSESKFRSQVFGEIVKERMLEYRKIGDTTHVDCFLEDVVCVGNASAMSGVEPLQEKILAATTDTKFLSRTCVTTPVPKGTVAVYRAIWRLRESHDYVSLDQLLRDMEEPVSEEEVITALQVVANSGFVHFFANLDASLSGFIVLNCLFLRDALLCILRTGFSSNFRAVWDLVKKDLKETYEEHEITRSLIGSDLSTHCPLLSTDDVRALLKPCVHNDSIILVEGPKKRDVIDCFLERLFVHSGVFIPLQTQLPDSVVHFVPCLVLQIDLPQNAWTFMSHEKMKITLCHTWLFRKGVTDGLMERVAVVVLQALYGFLNEKLVEPVEGASNKKHQIHQILCFKDSFFASILSTFDRSETGTGDALRSNVDLFIGVVDETSSHAVATGSMDTGMQKLIVVGKGLRGSNGRLLWKGGFSCVVETVRKLLNPVPNTVPEIVCYDCLAQDSTKSAGAWHCDVFMAEHSPSSIWCPRGHCVRAAILTGNMPDVGRFNTYLGDEPLMHNPSVSILPGVVFIGVWDPDDKRMVEAGSGFIVDGKIGLVVTAGHVLFNLRDKTSSTFGKPYHGSPNGRAVIAVIPQGGNGGKQAVFRYFAEIVTHDIPFAEIISHNVPFVDACVLKITARIDDTTHLSGLNQSGRPISLSQMPNEHLWALPISTEFQLEQAVRITGFNQGGECRYPLGGHISLSVDVVCGYICSHYLPPILLFDHGLGIRRTSVIPINNCPTMSGHSGGPCATQQGHVIGILSERDHAEYDRRYVVPVSEIQPLIEEARRRVGNL